MVLSIFFTHSRSKDKQMFPQSRVSVQSRLDAFKFDVRASVPMPAPTHALMLYPGRVWRLEWGDMKDYQGKSDARNGEKMVPLGPTTMPSPTSKVYF